MKSDTCGSLKPKVFEGRTHLVSCAESAGRLSRKSRSLVTTVKPSPWSDGDEYPIGVS